MFSYSDYLTLIFAFFFFKFNWQHQFFGSRVYYKGMLNIYFIKYTFRQKRLYKKSTHTHIYIVLFYIRWTKGMLKYEPGGLVFTFNSPIDFKNSYSVITSLTNSGVPISICNCPMDDILTDLNFFRLDVWNMPP